jgi:hypothetical protein
MIECVVPSGENQFKGTWRLQGRQNDEKTLCCQFISVVLSSSVYQFQFSSKIKSATIPHPHRKTASIETWIVKATLASDGIMLCGQSSQLAVRCKKKKENR